MPSVSRRPPELAAAVSGTMNDPVAPGAVVCGVVDSPCSRLAARVAGALADALDARLVLAHVLGADRHTVPLGPGRPEDVSREVERADGELAAAGYTLIDQVAARAAAPRALRRVMRHGNPARRLAALAQASDAALLVVGTRGQRTVRDALSVSSQLAADAPCPVIIVPARAADVREADGLRCGELVCGYDGSPSAWLAACAAAALAARLGGGLRLVAVGANVARLADAEFARTLHSAALDGLRGTDRPAQRLDVRVETRRGDPAEQLEATAAAATAPLLVVGTRGLDPRRGALLGPVSQRVVRVARRPVMMVPATMSAREAVA
jgi:nucleotide-binding universal stress UspA family protein